MSCLNMIYKAVLLFRMGSSPFCSARGWFKVDLRLNCQSCYGQPCYIIWYLIGMYYSLLFYLTSQLFFSKVDHMLFMT
jgi:hypothetical protein